MEEMNNSTETSFFCNEGVKACKCERLKTRLRTLILERGMSEPEFFHKVGLSRQHWYAISWGISPASSDLKLKIAQALGVDTVVIWGDLE